MKLLFPQNPMMRKLPEPVFEREFDAAGELGFPRLLYDEEELTHRGPEAAVSRLPDGDGEPLLLRGWILTEEAYRRFYHALLAKGYRLVSTADQYAGVTYFPNYHPKVREVSPEAVWTDTPDPYLAYSRSRTLGDGPFVLKDHIKSAKHRWHEACFAPKGAGREHFEAVAEALLAEQGKAFNRGFVVRRYVPLRSRGVGPRKYPLCEEYRLFFWHGKLLVASHYHDQPAGRTDWAEFETLAGRFDAPFFSMDVAQADDGRWLVVDMGAGECSSLPPSLPADAFYRRLRDVLNRPDDSAGGPA